VNAWHASALGENCDVVSLRRASCSAVPGWPSAGLHAGASMWLALDGDPDGLQRLAYGVAVGRVVCVW
jgi:hypothetical protein